MGSCPYPWEITPCPFRSRAPSLPVPCSSALPAFCSPSPGSRRRRRLRRRLPLPPTKCLLRRWPRASPSLLPRKRHKAGRIYPLSTQAPQMVAPTAAMPAPTFPRRQTADRRRSSPRRASPSSSSKRTPASQPDAPSALPPPNLLNSHHQAARTCRRATACLCLAPTLPPGQHYLRSAAWPAISSMFSTGPT